MTMGQNGSSPGYTVPEGAPPPLDMTVREHATDVVEVAVAGEIDFATHRSLLGLLTEEVERGHQRIVLDMSGVSFCDSTGLGVLVQIRQRVVEGGGWLRVAAPTEAVRRALEITNLDRLIPAYATVSDAVAEA